MEHVVRRTSQCTTEHLNMAQSTNKCRVICRMPEIASHYETYFKMKAFPMLFSIDCSVRFGLVFIPFVVP